MPRPASIAARMRSSVSARAPLWMPQWIPASAIALTMIEPVLAHVGLAADQRDLPRAEFGELTHDVEAFGGGQLIRALVSGARAAMGAAQVAGERQFPHDMDRAAASRVLVGGKPPRQLPFVLIRRARRQLAVHVRALRSPTWLSRRRTSRSSLRQRRLEIALSREDRGGVLAQRLERIKFGLRIGERMIDKRAKSSRHRHDSSPRQSPA